MLRSIPKLQGFQVFYGERMFPVEVNADLDAEMFHYDSLLLSADVSLNAFAQKNVWMFMLCRRSPRE